MPAYVALLRAVNVAGRNMVSMSDLRAMATRLGLAEPRTLLQSGNLVFTSSLRSSASIERLLEEGAAQHLGLTTDFILRSADELRVAIADNPFKGEARNDPSRLLTMFARAPLTAPQEKALQQAITGREVARVKGRHAYIYYPDGAGRSKLTTAIIEKRLETRVTGRNWNTVLKLKALVEQ